MALSHSRASAGPMPPYGADQTMGRKERWRSTQPGRCFRIFSLARSEKRMEASLAALARWDGRRGAETVASKAVWGGWRS